MTATTAAITVLGLGTGDEDQLTLGAWKKLQAAAQGDIVLYLRTADHPMVRLLESQSIPFETFDDIYTAHDRFEQVYETIAGRLLELAANGRREVVYAVPGHPMVAEYTVQLLRQRCSAEGVELRLMGGESFVDQAFLRFGFDPIDGFQLLDATSLSRYSLNPQLHTIIGQVYDALTASDVKLTLMEAYPDDYRVVVGHSLGVAGAEAIEEVPLHELDRVKGFGNLSLVWVPRAERDTVAHARTFGRLHEIVQVLRSPEGCPWDREQTHASLRKNLIEETYEVLETIDDDDPDAMCEELGDLLLQVMLHAQMEEEVGAFSVYDVVAGLNDKLVRRHPHVFGENKAGSADEALVNWNEMKAEEKRKKGIDPQQLSVLSGVPRDLPGLMKAYKLQKKAATVGFDWSDVGDVIAKIEEELQELREAMAGGSDEERLDELGDLLFAVVNLARFLKLDPEEAVNRTNRKFVQRFGYIEESLRLRGRTFEQTDLSELEKYWQEAKKSSKI
ncbi:nucleoside triphosphate pyrophosphohydrolase [Paenibacillus athensensis]|uniref:Nucleoside triphosphate pyrophosphohydrolase n=1 Tax=Paenibacillus athensensis TaxID=1967502 RepID=A0A4Y8PVB1_9BACL|nr:nucleoside triphosphate pyrophosphohydrolase [Paenibacillus athensensis]MCD1261884.1 nucleoside triphosphate pyrophosphohydrolase [Paenibacillus athensensis]